MPSLSTTPPPWRGRPPTTKLTAATLSVVVAGTTAVAVTSSPATAVELEPITTTLVDTSALTGTPTGVALTDEAVFVETTTDAGAAVQWRPRSGGEWSRTWGGVELTGELEAAEKDVVHLDQGEHDLLVWARDGGGSREVPTGTALGYSARYVTVPRDDHYEAQNVLSEGVVQEFGTLDTRHYVAGRTLRTARTSSDEELIWFTDHWLDAGRHWHTASADCTDTADGPAVFEDADERISLVRCADTVLAIDHHHVYRKKTVVDGIAPNALLLGDGFLLSTDRDTGIMVVTPLYQESKGSLGTVSDQDLDDRRSHAVVLTDDDVVRLADLSEWSTDLATTSAETVPPTTTVTISGTTQGSTYAVSISARDAVKDEMYVVSTRVTSYEAEYRVQMPDAEEPGPWIRKETFLDHWVFPASVPAEDATVCWRARSTDAAGNQGDWSEIACSVMDRVRRLAGTTRYETAVEISKATFQPGVSDVYVATGSDFPDALAGASAAGSKDSPVLLVKRDSVPRSVADEIRRLAPHRIVVLGGTGVISSAVADKLRTYAPVKRLGGKDRYQTAALVSRDAYAPLNGNQYVAVKVASGSTFPDALAAASAEEHYDLVHGEPLYVHSPLLLTRKDSVPEATRDEIRRIDPAHISIIGGSGVVSGDVHHDLRAILDADGDGLPDYDTPDTGGGVGRYAGADRYETAAQLVGYFPVGRKVVYVATGQAFPDALTGAAAARANNAPVVMVKPGSIPAASKNQLERLDPQSIVVLGGEGAVSADVEAQLAGFVK